MIWLFLFALALGQSQWTCETIVSDDGMTSRHLLEVLGGGQCTDPTPPPEPCVPEPEICGDGIDQDCDGADLQCTGGGSGGSISFERFDTPPNGGGNKYFGVYSWQGFVSIHDHSEPGNDPKWQWNGNGFDYIGQMSQTAQIRHSNMIKLSTGVWPVSGAQGFGSGRVDTVHENGVAKWLCTDNQWWIGACQGWGDFDADGIDDVLRSDGQLLKGADLPDTRTVIASGFTMFGSSFYTKAACVWQNRVLTDDGLFDASGTLLTTVPGGTVDPVRDTVGPGIRGGYACGDFDADGDLDVFYSEGGSDFLAGGTSHLLKNNGDDTFTDVLSGSGLPAAGGPDRRYTLNHTPDFDGDGCADLLLADHAKVFQSNCDLTFTEIAVSIPTPDNKRQAAPGDFDGDGRPDFCATTGGPSAACFRTIVQ